MSNPWRKLMKSLSLRLPTQQSLSLNAPPCDFVSDISEPDIRPSTPTPSSSGMRLSRSSSRSTKKTCAICLGSMKLGQGHALFTAECSHSFHFNCIASSVKHGNQLCPICRSQWKEIPFQAPIVDPQSNSRTRVTPFDTPLDDVHVTLQRHLPHQSYPEPRHYSDDEPLLSSPSQGPTASSPRQMMKIKAYSEFPAVPALESSPQFAVLVSIRAPALPADARNLDRAPIDLVLVLDISGSMAGTKLTLLKHAVNFVILNLGPSDRLSIVTFSSSARRLFRLCRMSDAGRDRAILAVNSLTSSGGTNIVDGLRKGARVLEERREKNPVSSIILLSDGKDTYNTDNYNHRRNSHSQPLNPRRGLDYLNLLPPSICHGTSSGEGPPSIPVHTFGFGADHDATSMHAMSDASGGTFSFIQAEGVIQDAFARCIGGLLSVVAQELQVKANSSTAGVSIGSILTGSYSSQVSDRSRQAVINVGDLYADEEKDFLIHVSVPVVSEHEDRTTLLLRIGCTYKNPISRETIRVECEPVKIHRPESLSSDDQMLCLEVDRQRNRLWVAEGIAEAQGMADKGNLEGAQSVLAARRSALLASASAQAGDGLCNWLEAELKEIRERMASQEMYEESGRAYMLSGLSSHSWQRATTRGDSGSSVDTNSTSGAIGGGYETPSMVNMVTRSQTLFCSAPEPARPLQRSCSLARRRG